MDYKGFTLIEIVIVIVVMAILGAFTFAFIDHASIMYATATRQRMLYQEASYMMERITREVRDARSISISPSAISISKAHGTTFDPTLDITFKILNGNMIRSSGGIDQIIGTNISSFTPLPVGNCLPPSCFISINLELYDPRIPKYDPKDTNNLSKKVFLTSGIAPKNFVYSQSDRCFNGDYEETIRY